MGADEYEYEWVAQRGTLDRLLGAAFAAWVGEKTELDCRDRQGRGSESRIAIGIGKWKEG
jgi:hypothetical protein